MRRQHLESLLVIVTGMVGLYFLWGQEVFLYIALGVGLVGILIPPAAKYIHLGWAGLGHLLGWINQNILFAILFFLVLTPLAILRKWVGKDVLHLRRTKGETYFVTRDHPYGPKDLENPW